MTCTSSGMQGTVSVSITLELDSRRWSAIQPMRRGAPESQVQKADFHNP